ncbi:MAG: ribosome-associated heat shock protein Hsp15 [Pseudomonadota bacterium]|nr:ribosome-associated heat shock protein Hsp15 [Pseudomonadota bacterium]
MGQDAKSDSKIRLDKWLWAARFYKTRSIAKDMIEGGKVHYEGHRVKASKEVTLGAQIRLRQGFDEKTVVVMGLSDRRGNAVAAAALYEETDASIELRQRASAQRKAMSAAHPGSDNRPNKKQRRQIIQFRHQQSE